MSRAVTPSPIAQKTTPPNSTEQVFEATKLDLSNLGIPVAEAGQPGQICLLNKGCQPGTTAVRTLLIHERTAPGADTLENYLEDGEHAAISIRADQFTDGSHEENNKSFSTLLQELRAREIINTQTEIYILLHGQAEKDLILLSNSSTSLRMDIFTLLANLGRGPVDSRSKGVVRIFCCESKNARKTLTGYPHNFLFLSDRWSMARPDAVATLKEQFRLSKLCIDEPPTPEQALRNAAMISGEDPTLVGNGILQTIDIASQPHEELSSRPIQLDNYLARTIIHESFNELVRVLSQFDFDYRERKIFSAALCVTADTDNQNKLLLHIALGGDLNRLERGQTALHYASKLKKSDLVSILLENGADPD